MFGETPYSADRHAELDTLMLDLRRAIELQPEQIEIIVYVSGETAPETNALDRPKGVRFARRVLDEWRAMSEEQREEWREVADEIRDEIGPSRPRSA